MPARYGVLVTSAGASPVELVVESAVYRDYGSQFWASGANARRHAAAVKPFKHPFF